MSAERVTQFHAFGLSFESDFPVERWFGPEVASSLPRANGAVDVRIRVRSAADRTSEAIPEPTPDRLVLDVGGVARYDVRNGHEILVNLHPESDDASVGVYLFGSALGALLHQRGLLPLHASAVEIDSGGCALFVGPSGAGKSTLAAALGRRGRPPFTDDVAALSFDPRGCATISRGLPRLKVPEDVVLRLGDDPAGLARVMPALDKLSVPLDFAQSSVSTLEVRQVWVLNPGPYPAPDVVPLRGSQKVAALIDNTYRYCFVRAYGSTALHFDQCLRLASCVPVLRLNRPEAGFAVAEMVELLERWWL